MLIRKHIQYLTLLILLCPLPSNASEISDPEWRRFAEAYLKIQQIKALYAGRLDDRSEEKQKELHEAIRRRIEIAIQQSGMMLSRYYTILNKVEADPEARKRLSVEIERLKN